MICANIKQAYNPLELILKQISVQEDFFVILDLDKECLILSATQSFY